MRVNIRRASVLAGLTALAGVALTGGVLAGPAAAADAYNATAAGFPAFTPLVALAPSSTQTVAVVNLPANVGLYVLHCKTPADPRQAPTLCDTSTGAFNLVQPDPAGKASVSVPIKLNAEFLGINPNPTASAAAPQSVDCRVPSADPRSTTCTLYVLGSGRDSANPAYIRVWPTQFSPVRADRKTDAATIALDGKAVAAGTTPTLKANVATPLSVKTTSGLTPSMFSDKCSVSGGNITALAATGSCTLTITTTGGKNFKPLVATQVFTLS